MYMRYCLINTVHARSSGQIWRIVLYVEQIQTPPSEVGCFEHLSTQQHPTVFRTYNHVTWLKRVMNYLSLLPNLALSSVACLVLASARCFQIVLYPLLHVLFLPQHAASKSCSILCCSYRSWLSTLLPNLALFSVAHIVLDSARCFQILLYSLLLALFLTQHVASKSCSIICCSPCSWLSTLLPNRALFSVAHIVLDSARCFQIVLYFSVARLVLDSARCFQIVLYPLLFILFLTQHVASKSCSILCCSYCSWLSTLLPNRALSFVVHIVLDSARCFQIVLYPLLFILFLTQHAASKSCSILCCSYCSWLITLLPNRALSSVVHIVLDSARCFQIVLHSLLLAFSTVS